ncbi:hypothetical protein [Lewinella sp. LCG006]|uniref:VPS10 domain-containing protein n=1 Tax=Lewinella sp. LCG006 TaxID=3231911 RepID=UPI0034602887
MRNPSSNFSQLLLCILFIGIIFLCCAIPATAQIYQELSQDTNLTFQEIVDISERHFEKTGKGKGKGYKQFQRWKYWAERNLDEQGSVRSQRQALDAYLDFVDKSSSAPAKFLGSYTELGPQSAINTSTWSSGLGRVSAIGLDPNNDNHIIVGSPTGGIWKTMDLGTSWTPIFDDQALIDVYALEISHGNPDHYWAGLSDGLVRSLDGGLSWSPVSGVSATALYNTIVMHPANADVIFAVSQSGRIYKSTDGGENFYTVLVQNESLYDLEFHPVNLNIIYASGNDGVYKSTDGGETFTEITSGPWSGIGNKAIMLAVTPAAPQRIYALEEIDGGFNALYLSQNAGASWITLANNACDCNNIMGYDQDDSGGQAPRDMDIVVSPVNPSIIHVAGVETWRSTNAGQSWNKTTAWNNPNGSNFIHADIDLLIYDGQRIVAGTDGGIYYSTDEADSWTNITPGLGIRQFYRIGAARTEIDRVSGGSQDNGTTVFRNGNWYDWLGADGMETFIAWDNDDIIYGTSQNGSLYKSLNGGNSRMSITAPGGSGNWVTPFEQAVGQPNLIYTARTELWKSTDGGNSWLAISDLNMTNKADELKIAPSDHQYIYLAYENRLYITTDGGANWTSSNLPGSSVNYITVHPNHPERLIVVISGSSSKVMESLDAGVTWTNLTANIPSAVGIECAVYDELNNEGVFIGGNPGIYYTDATSDVNWVNLSDNLPNVRIAELEIKNQILYVATYGRGLWKRSILCDGSLEGQACNDFDACTENDVFDADCNCTGALVDADNDGVCDETDACPGGDDNIDGDHDGIPDFCDNCAEDCPDADCDSVCDADDICPGGDDTRDMDNDGIPDYCDPCDEQIGLPCDDNNPCTNDDTYDSDCNCIGTFQDTDGDGICDRDDVCHGGDDTLDSDGDGIPDHCDNCGLNEAVTITLVLTLDDYPQETSWEVTNATGEVIVSSYGTYADWPDGAIVTELICLPLGCYEFTIFDSYGDGLCCNYGIGGYELFDASGVLLAIGSDFDSSENTSFCNTCDDFGGDTDDDGVCDVRDLCPDMDDALIGTPCDDGDPCTANDLYDTNCNCAGTFTDADNDGVCDADDVCPDNDDNLIGTPCDDGDPCTTNDLYDTNCNCAGTFADADNDGICDVDDVCPDNDDNLIGTPCDDGDPCTTNDVYDTNCNCAGTFADADNDGVCDADDVCPDNDDNLIGTPCDDGDPCTTNDLYDTNCNCAGTFADADNDGVCDADDVCPDNDDNLIGTPCDDGDPCTTNDLYDTNCNCAGTFADADNDGVCDADDVCPDNDDNLIGTPCDDGDPCTTNDLYDTNCNCAGTFADADNDGVCDADDVCPGNDDNLIGTPCDDGDPCTTNDLYDTNCNCAGTFADADNDGVCDADDVCPGNDDNLIGTACDDGDPCTTNDLYDTNCNCAGTFADADNDGVCDADDVCPENDDNLIGTPCDDGDPCTANDLYDTNCNCAGTFADADNDGVCDADDVCPDNDDNLIGTPCDDGDPCTTNDLYDTNCNCAGTFADADNDGVCDADDVCPGGDDNLIGTPCDDGDPCTINDLYDTNCNCAGTFADADNDGICDADDVCPGGDDNLDVNNNGVPDDCDVSTTQFPSLEEKSLRIFPNPAIDLLRYSFDSKMGKDYHISIKNILGATVLQMDFKGTGNTITGQIHAQWTPGLYLFILQSDSGLNLQPVIIQ